MGSPWNTPSVPRRSASMAPVFFPVFLPAQGGPAVLGLGSLLTGGLLPGLDPLGVLQLQGLLGFGADAGAVWG